MQIHADLPIEDLGSLHAADGSVDIMARIVLRWAARALQLAGFVALGACSPVAGPDVNPQRLLDAMRSRLIVLPGEVHDNAEQHALRDLLEACGTRWTSPAACPVGPRSVA